MSTRSNSRASAAHTNGIEMIAAARIRRPCNNRPERILSLALLCIYEPGRIPKVALEERDSICV